MEKHQYMRSFISAASEYTKHPSEASVSVLQRNLGVIGVSLDLSMFDPGSSVAAEFYVSLHELMNSLESRTPLIWSALDALQNACKNAAARQALIHTYKFAPILTRLLETNLTAEKRVKVLKLLQELTYGVKLSWQEAHLPYLISPLTQWVMQSKDEDVIALSLGILVNLCYKNLPAVYTLMRTVDTKTFLRTLLKIQSTSVNTRVQCCKMMIILENGNKDISEKHILEFVTTTFTTLVTALEDHDVSLLRHIVDFFNDVRQNEHTKNVLLHYETYTRDVEAILKTLENNSDPDCISLVMEFLLSLVSLKLPSLVGLYPMCVKVAMTWVPVEQVCSKALALIRTVVIDSRRSKTPMDVLAELDLSVLMLVASCDDEDENDDACNKGALEKRSAETESRLTELMQLLQEMARIPTLKNKVMQAFGEPAMRKLFGPMLERDGASTTPNNWPGNLFNDPGTTLYVHAIALTADHAAHDSSWLTLYSELLQRKQMQMTMALALYTADHEVKQKVLQLTSSVGFPQECFSSVARCMSELQPLVLIQNSTGAITTAGMFPASGPSTEMTPLFSFNQESRLDAFLAKLEDAFNKNQIGDATTSAVMELYDYKLAAMKHAERATQASLEAASKHATSLQHRLAQIVAESNRLHQLLFHNQQCLEGVRAEKATLTGTIQAQVKQIQEIPKLKKIVSEKSAAIDRGNLASAELKKELEVSLSKIDAYGKRIKDLEAELSEAEANAKDMHNKRSELKKMFTKLQETVNKKDQIIEERERELEQNREGMSALKQEIQQLGRQCQTYEQTIAEKEENVQRMMSELVDLSRMRDMIYQLTAKKKEDSNTTT